MWVETCYLIQFTGGDWIKWAGARTRRWQQDQALSHLLSTVQPNKRFLLEYLSHMERQVIRGQEEAVVKEPRQWQDPSACTHSSAQELRDGTGTGRDSAGTADGQWRDGQAQLRQGLALAGHPGLPFMPTTATLTDHHSFHREKSTEGKKRFATSHKKMVQGKAEKLVKL